VLCPITEGLCFWGERTSYTPWKRQLLPWLSLAAFTLLAVVWLEQRRPPDWFIWVISTILLAFAVTGLASAFWGCNRCVVRVWGDVG
jgi:hypothetical protein